MENTSKALIIVAGFLVGLMLFAIVVFFFNRISVVPTLEDDATRIEQISTFNLEYEVYDKKLMYGVDVISALNKANNNNLKYVAGNFLSGVKDGEEFIIDVIVTLKGEPLKERIEVKFFRFELGKPVERMYMTGEGPTGVDMKDAGFIVPTEYNSRIYNSGGLNSNSSLITQDIVTSITAGEYHLLEGGVISRGNINNITDLRALLQISDRIKQTQKNKNSSIEAQVADEWSSATWETALYDLKTRKFKCTEINYSSTTGRIDRLAFEEI